MADQPEKQRRLAVAMIVRNAAELLPETVVSIRGIADEIVVLDTGSTDDTVSVAQRLGARVVHKAWEESFSVARNACLTYVQSPWVLWLDAGESISRDQGRWLREFLERRADDSCAYSLPVSVPAIPGEIDGEQVFRVRLHPNRPGIQYSGRIRESLDRSLFAFGVRQEELSSVVIRRGNWEHDSGRKTARAKRNLELAELQLAQRGPTPALYNCMGEAWQMLGEGSRSIQQYRQALEMAGAESLEQLEAFYGLLTGLDGSPEHRAAQIEICLQALEVFPLDAHLLCAMGGYLQWQGKTELAMRSYGLAFQHGKIESRLWHLPEIRPLAAVTQAMTLFAQDEVNRAEEVLRQALAQYPESSRLMRQLIEILSEQGRREEALELVDRMPPDQTNREVFRTAVQGVCLAVGGNWIAAKAFLETARKSGFKQSLAYRWLIKAWLKLERHEDAERTALEWRDAVGNVAEVQRWIRDLGTVVPPLAVGSAVNAAQTAAPVPGTHSGAIRIDGQGSPARIRPPRADELEVLRSQTQK